MGTKARGWERVRILRRINIKLTPRCALQRTLQRNASPKETGHRSRITLSLSLSLKASTIASRPSTDFPRTAPSTLFRTLSQARVEKAIFPLREFQPFQRPLNLVPKIKYSKNIRVHTHTHICIHLVLCSVSGERFRHVRY